MIRNLTDEEYDICTNCIHADVCKYSPKVKNMIESIGDAITARLPIASTGGIVEYPLKLKLKAECELFKAKGICRS